MIGFVSARNRPRSLHARDMRPIIPRFTFASLMEDWFDGLSTFFQKNGAYGAMMTTRPQTVGYGLSDSPAGLAAWMYDRFAQWTYSGDEPKRSLTRDEILDDITLYWLTNSAISSAQLYWENNANNFNAVDISIPAAITDRLVSGGIGHNLPQEAPQAFAQAVIDVAKS